MDEEIGPGLDERHLEALRIESVVHRSIDGAGFGSSLSATGRPSWPWIFGLTIQPAGDRPRRHHHRGGRHLDRAGAPVPPPAPA